METGRRKFEMWRDRDWHCESSIVGGRQLVRLYLDNHLVSDVTDGPKLDVLRQSDEWRSAASPGDALIVRLGIEYASEELTSLRFSFLMLPKGVDSAPCAAC
jgi:hypothetical protein